MQPTHLLLMLALPLLAGCVGADAPHAETKGEPALTAEAEAPGDQVVAPAHAPVSVVENACELPEPKQRDSVMLATVLTRHYIHDWVLDCDATISLDLSWQHAATQLELYVEHDGHTVAWDPIGSALETPTSRHIEVTLEPGAYRAYIYAGPVIMDEWNYTAMFESVE